MRTWEVHAGSLNKQVEFNLFFDSMCELMNNEKNNHKLQQALSAVHILPCELKNKYRAEITVVWVHR